MNADLVMIIALLSKLDILKAKDAKNLYDDLKYRNLSMSLDDCMSIINDSFKKHNIGKAPDTTDLVVGGQKIKVTK